MEKILENLELTPSEIKLYQSLLRTGESKVGNLIKESSIASSKIYDVIERLKDKGLVSYKIIDNIKFFKATNPNHLKFLLNEKKKEIEEQEREVDSILNSLNLFNLNDEGKVEFFEGIKGVRMAHNILFSKANKDSLLKYFFPYSNISEEQDLFYKKLWLDHEHLELKSKGISVVEVRDDPKYKKIINEDTMKFVNFPLPGTIDILENSILIISWTNKPTAVLISSIEIVKHFENYFDSIWESN